MDNGLGVGGIIQWDRWLCTYSVSIYKGGNALEKNREII